MAGVAIGIAAVLKLWPLLLLIPLWWTGRRWAALVGAATCCTVTAVGMFVFGLTPLRMVDAFAAATDRWIVFSGNGSVIGWVVRAGVPQVVAAFVGIGTAAFLTWVVTRRAPDYGFPAAITLALLVSPLSWEHYDIVLVGVAVWLITKSRWQRNVAVTWLALAVTGMGLRVFATPEFTPIGVRTLAGRLLLAIAVLVPVLVGSERRNPRQAAAFAEAA